MHSSRAGGTGCAINGADAFLSALQGRDVLATRRSLRLPDRTGLACQAECLSANCEVARRVGVLDANLRRLPVWSHYQSQRNALCVCPIADMLGFGPSGHSNAFIGKACRADGTRRTFAPPSLKRGFALLAPSLGTKSIIGSTCYPSIITDNHTKIGVVCMLASGRVISESLSDAALCEAFGGRCFNIPTRTTPILIKRQQ